MRKKIFVVLLLVVVLITSVGCNHESNPKASCNYFCSLCEK